MTASSYFLRNSMEQQQQQPFQHHSVPGSRAMSAYSPLNNSQQASPTSAVASSAANSPSGTTFAATNADRPLLFNDIDTHDIVIVAAGDRGLSSAHNQMLQNHTKQGGCSSSERELALAAQTGSVAGGAEFRVAAAADDDRHARERSTSSSPEQQYQMDFYAHKDVLSAGSAFFRNLFADEKAEKLRFENEQQQQQRQTASRNNNNNNNNCKTQTFEPCRRLVVHNVLPASLAHILQSLYAAYANGVIGGPNTHNDGGDDAVTLYDPVSLSSSPPSVIICAWELAMKLGLRAAAASITHMLIPLVDRANSLEVLKASSKYDEHEFSIVLQRAVVHAKALPPIIHSVSDRRLWQELCASIPWLESTAELLRTTGEHDMTGSHRQGSLVGRNQARAALIARSRQKMLDAESSRKAAAVFGEDDDDDNLDEEGVSSGVSPLLPATSRGGNRNRDEDDDDESVGASAQRAWDETNSSQMRQRETQEQSDVLRRRHEGDVDDEHDEKEQRQQDRAPIAFQQHTNQRLLGVNSRLTPIPLTSVEALCLHSDRAQMAAAAGGSRSRSTSEQQQQHQQQQQHASRNHHASASAPVTSLKLTNAASASGHEQQSRLQVSKRFVPSGSTSAAEHHRHHHEQQQQQFQSKFVDPSGLAATLQTITPSIKHKVLGAAPAATMADAIQSESAAIRVTATRTVLRDAMSRSAASGNNTNNNNKQRVFSETADLPFQQQHHRHQHQHLHQQQQNSSPPSRTGSAGIVDPQQHLFVQKTLPDFATKFVQSQQYGRDMRKSKLCSALDDEEEDSQARRSHHAGAEETADVDDTATRHKIASLAKDIENTYTLYSTEMADYRAAYENLRKETTELWAATGLVEQGNVPSSVQVAEEMHHKLVVEREQEQRTRAELVGAMTAVAAQMEEETKFIVYAEQFMKAAGTTVHEYGSFLEQIRSLVQAASSSAANSGFNDPSDRAERLRSTRRSIEQHVDSAVRLVADEEREAEARLRAHELTLEQMMVDVEEEQKRLQATKMKYSGAGGKLIAARR